MKIFLPIKRELSSTLTQGLIVGISKSRFTKENAAIGFHKTVRLVLKMEKGARAPLGGKSTALVIKRDDFPFNKLGG